MKRFILKIVVVAILFIISNLILVFAIPADKNSSLCEYSHKISLLQDVDTPRVVIIGGSSVAFGTDSRCIHDSLGINVVNFGLHGGIGIRYVLDDYLQYIKKSDIVVLQIEYSNYYTGGNGNDRTLAQLMPATNWRNFFDLNRHQLANVLMGIPSVTIGNINRLLKYPIRKTWDSPSSSNGFRYVKDGFNEYGDEVSHWKYASKKNINNGKVQTSSEINDEFIAWLSNILNKCDDAGVKVFMIPPVNIVSNHMAKYNPKIEKRLKEIGRPYMVSPTYMVLDDSCTFDGGYHVNREGVRQNTAHLIEILRKEI